MHALFHNSRVQNSYFYQYIEFMNFDTSDQDSILGTIPTPNNNYTDSETQHRQVNFSSDIAPSSSHLPNISLSKNKNM